MVIKIKGKRQKIEKRKEKQTKIIEYKRNSQKREKEKKRFRAVKNSNKEKEKKEERKKETAKKKKNWFLEGKIMNCKAVVETANKRNEGRWFKNFENTRCIE